MKRTIVLDTIDMAYEKGVYAAHEKITPVCPYNRHYEYRNHQAWYNGLATERVKSKAR